MSMFKEVADIKTVDMLKLPVPEAEYHNVSVEPSEMQKDMVASLAERAEKQKQYWYREVGGYLQGLRLSYPTLFIFGSQNGWYLRTVRLQFL